MSNKQLRNKLQQLILGDALGDMAGFLDNIIDKLDVDGLDEDILGNGHEEHKRTDRIQKKKVPKVQPQATLSENEDQNKGSDESEDEGSDIKSDRGSFKVEDDSSSQSSSPLKGEPADQFDRQNLPNKKQVHFSPTNNNTAATNSESNGAPQYKGVKLPALYSNDRQGEIVYKLTELYLPETESQLKRRQDYNRDLILGPNHLANEHMLQAYKRKVKGELLQARRKIKHQIKYCQVPPAQMEETMYRYRAGMTSRDIARMKAGNRYENASHIGRIVPSKRPAPAANVNYEQNLIRSEKGQRKEEAKVKDYTEGPEEHNLIECDFRLMEISKSVKEALGIQNMLTEKDLPKEKVDELFDVVPISTHCDSIDKSMSSIEESKELKPPVTSQTLDSDLLKILDKIKNQELSLAQISPEERSVIKRYINIQVTSVVNSKYPQKIAGLNEVQKNSYVFMKNLDQKNFSYRGAPSKLQSDENNDEMGDEGAFEDAPMYMNVTRHPIFNIGSQELQNQGEGADGKPTDEANFNGATNIQIYQWYQDQKLQEASKGQSYKRRRYWGEPTDCSSYSQIKKENYLYSQFKKFQSLSRGLKDEKIFTFDVQNKQQQQQQAKAAQILPSNGKPIISAVQEKKASVPIKDLKEYEYFQKQRALFYSDGHQGGQSQSNEADRKLNSILRHIKFQLGEISAEEFYTQEALDYQTGSQVGASSKNTQYPTSDSFTKLRKFQVNPVLADHHSEMYDHHFELTKKEKHDRMMARLQLQEKQNQPQSASGQTTIAYASGQDVLQKVIGSANLVIEKRDKYQAAHDKNDDLEEEKDEDMDDLGDHQMQGSLSAATSAGTKNSHNQDGGITAEDNMRLRVTKSRANELNHAKCILKLTYTKFEWSENELVSFHRPSIQDVIRDRAYSQMLGDRPSMNVKVLTNEQIEKRSKKIGINAHEHFKDRFKLSLKDGRFCLFEHVDQRPLFVNNFGMASKLKRYVYADEMLPHTAFKRKPENAGLKHMGPYGVQVLKKKGEKIPLLGQIDPRQYRGLTVLENNMYYCPVFYQRTNRNNFLCVVHQDKHGNNQIFVRELQEMYLMGQIEPKSNIEVYNPQSRQYQHFIKKRTQAYVIRFLQENENRISFSELNKYFAYINDQILKKIIKDINVEVDRNQICSLAQEYKDEQFKSLITPENICQYESALYGEQMLKKVGIKEITNADKISYATNKFCSEETDLKKQLIARIIEEEVLSTPWNLSQNFNHNRQQKGMMMLEGIGDPSNGHGGYSYLKLPLKISQDSLNKAKINRMYLNPAIQNPKAVTGTDADLRKLSKSAIQQKLQDLGFKKDAIKDFSRWQMVALLRDKSSQAVTQGIEGENKKFARGVRFTSKKQREMYQKQVNDIFKKQIHYLQQESGDVFNDLSDVESKDQRQKKFKEIQQINSNNSKSIVELKEDIEVKKIQDIPGYEILVLNNAAQGTAPTGAPAGHPGISGAINSMNVFQGYENQDQARKALSDKLAKGELTLECTILRKKIKPVSEGNQEEEKIERVIFCSDLRQIKGFKKRKHKHEVKTKRTKKTSLKEKMQTSKPFMSNLSDLRNGDRPSETQSKISAGMPTKGSNNKNEPSPVKIKIGASQGQKNASFAEPASIKIPTGPIQIQPQQQSSKFTINLSNVPYSQYGNRQDQASYGSSIQDFSTTSIRLGLPQADQSQQDYNSSSFTAPKIQISLGGGGIPPPSVSNSYKYYEEEKQDKRGIHRQGSNVLIVGAHHKGGEAAKGKLPVKPAQKPQRSSSIELKDEEYEQNLYKPRVVQPSRRRQKAEEVLLNEIFENVIDSCIKQDRQKIFSAPVKSKDAPRYYEIIQNPIDLGSMKNKAKRSEYYSREEFLSDFDLLWKNAEQYNGIASVIAQEARNIFEHAQKKLNEQQTDILSYEALVREKVLSGLLPPK